MEPVAPKVRKKRAGVCVGGPLIPTRRDLLPNDRLLNQPLRRLVPGVRAHVKRLAVEKFRYSQIEVDVTQFDNMLVHYDRNPVNDNGALQATSNRQYQ